MSLLALKPAPRMLSSYDLYFTDREHSEHPLRKSELSVALIQQQKHTRPTWTAAGGFNCCTAHAEYWRLQCPARVKLLGHKY